MGPIASAQANASSRRFVDTVIKIKQEGKTSQVTFQRAALVYQTQDKELLKKLRRSLNEKKAVEVTASKDEQKILVIKGL